MSEKDKDKTSADTTPGVEPQSLSAEERARIVQQLYAARGVGGVMAGQPSRLGLMHLKTRFPQNFQFNPKKKG